MSSNNAVTVRNPYHRGTDRQFWIWSVTQALSHMAGLSPTDVPFDYEACYREGYAPDVAAELALMRQGFTQNEEGEWVL